MKMLLAATGIISGLVVLSSCERKEEPEVTEKIEEKKAGSGGVDAEATALEAFKKQVIDLDLSRAVQAVEDAEATAETDPARLFNMVFNLNDKLIELKTEGLSSELKTATDTFQELLGGMSNHLKEIPIPMEVLSKGESGIEAWAGEQMAADPSFLEGFNEEMEAWETKLETFEVTLKTKEDEIKTIYRKYKIPVEFPEDNDDEKPLR